MLRCLHPTAKATPSLRECGWRLGPNQSRRVVGKSRINAPRVSMVAPRRVARKKFRGIAMRMSGAFVFARSNCLRWRAGVCVYAEFTVKLMFWKGCRPIRAISFEAGAKKTPAARASDGPRLLRCAKSVRSRVSSAGRPINFTFTIIPHGQSRPSSGCSHLF